MEVPITAAAPRFSEQELWLRYLGVTKELMKAIDMEDIDTFLQLVDQRQALLEKIQTIPKNKTLFSKSEAGMALKREIKPMDMQIIFKGRTWLNKAKNHTNTVRSYDVSYSATGNMFNGEY